jgi:hypothetical protein
MRRPADVPPYEPELYSTQVIVDPHPHNGFVSGEGVGLSGVFKRLSHGTTLRLISA